MNYQNAKRFLSIQYSELSIQLTKHAIVPMKMLTLFLAFFSCLTASALTGTKTRVTVDLLTYDLYAGDKTAQVILFNTNRNAACAIPETITNNGTTYTVTNISSTAFNYTQGGTTVNFGQYVTSLSIPSTVKTIPTSTFTTCTAVKYLYWYSPVKITSSHVSSMKNTLTSLTCDAPIDKKAFANCTLLEDIYWINNATKVTAIGDSAFYKCTALKTINNNITGLTTIGVGAFNHCTALSYANINSPALTSLGSDAFNFCKSLTAINLDRTQLSTIQTKAFYYCTDLNRVALPTTLTAINDRAFYYTSLKEIEGLENTKVTYIGEEAFYGSYGIGMTFTSLTFPSTLKTIKSKAFYRCKSIKEKITFPKSVTSIGSNAFAECSSVPEYIFEEGTEELTIGSGAFQGNTNLMILKWPSRCKSVPAYIFKNCTSLTSDVPKNITSIGQEAYYNCTALPDYLRISNHCTSIGKDAFYNCKQINDVCLFAPTSCFTAKDNPWGSSDGAVTRRLFLPYDTFKSSDMYSSLGFTTYTYYPDITRIYQSDGKTLQDGILTVYRGNTAVVYTIGQKETDTYCTSNVNSNTLLTFPTNSSVSWSNNSFVSITSEKVGGNTKHTVRGLKAYSNMSVSGSYYDSYKKLQHVTLQVKIIDVESINISQTSATLVRNNTLKLSTTSLPAGVDQSVTWSSSDPTVATVSAFGLVTSLKAGTATITATSANGVTASCEVTVEDAAVRLNTNSLLLKPGESSKLTATSNGGSVTWKSDNTSVAAVSSDGYILTYGEGTAIITATDSKYGYAVAQCMVVVSTEEIMYVGGIYYNPVGDGSANNVKVTNLGFSKPELYIDSDRSEYAGTINIPSQITYDGTTYNVTEIGDYAFYHMADLQMVIVPASVTRIGNHAFEYSKKMVRVQFAANSALNNIESYAFRGCYKLSSIAIPNTVEKIEQAAFQDCTSLATLTLPTGLATISPDLCRGCTVLDNMVIPSQVKVIGKNAFRECKALNTLTYPAALSMVDEYAFADCKSLSKVQLPASVASLQNSAYASCEALESVVLPASIEGIGASCFMQCPAMKEITFNNTKAITIGENAFEGCAALQNVKIADLTAWAHSNFSDKDANPLTYSKTLSLGNSQLSAIDIPASAQYVNQYAFNGITAAVNVPASVVAVSDEVATTVNKTEATLDISSRDASKTIDAYHTAVMMQPGDEISINKALLYENNAPSVVSISSGKVIAIGEGIAVLTAKLGDRKATLTIRVASQPVAYVGNMYYTLGTDGTAKVSNLGGGNSALLTYNTDRSDYSGVVNIPEYVTYAGKKYAVTEVEANAFQQMKHLQMVVVPKSITTVNANACNNSKNLARVLFTADGSLGTIAYGAFQSCEKLDDVTVPNTVKSIGASAFRDCKSLCKLTLSNAIDEISQYLCYGDSALNNVVIPSQVKVIGNSAFRKCQELDNIQYSSNLSMIDEYAFAECNSMKSVVLPEKTAALQNFAFADCENIADVTLPASIEGIGAGCFYNNGNLTNVEFKNTKPITVGDGAFARCNKLAEVRTADIAAWAMTNFGNAFANPTTLSKHLFLGEKELTSITLPANATYVNQYAFANLQSVTDITLPETVRVTAGRYNNLSEATVAKDEKTVSIDSRGSYKEDDDMLFRKLTMAMGSSVTVGENGTFKSSNTTVAIVDNNGKVTAVSPGMTLITQEKTDGNVAKCLIYVAAAAPAYVGNIYYDFSDKNTASVVNMLGKDGSAALASYTDDRYDYAGIVNIPATVTYGGKRYDVTEIAANAFYKMKNLEATVVPASVTTIGTSAFELSKNMARVWFPADSKLTTLKARAFNNDVKLDEVVLPNSLFTINEATFQYCEGLKNISLPNRLTTMGEYAFANCTSLEKIALPATLSAMQNYCFAFNPKLNNVVVPASMQGIGQNCFKNCTAMTDIKFLNTGVMTVGDYAFAGCTALKSTDVKNLDAWVMTNFSNDQANPLYFSKCISQDGVEKTVVKIPQTADYINQYAFVNCVKMTTCEIPSSVTTVSDNIFLGCSNLTAVKCHATKPADFIGTRDLAEMSSVFSKATLYVVEPAVEAYQADSYWKNYKNISIFVPVLAGDADGDGAVTMADAKAIAAYYVGKAPETFSTDAADVNCDGRINMLDATIIINQLTK